MSNERIVVHFQPSRKEFRHVCRRFLLKEGGVVPLALLGCIFIAAGILDRNPLSLLAGSIIALLATLTLFRMPSRRWKQSPSTQAPHQVTFDEHGLEIETIGIKCVISWTQISRITRDSTAAYLYGDFPTPLAFIPLRAISTADRMHVEALRNRSHESASH
jgi:hypothetical protein